MEDREGEKRKRKRTKEKVSSEAEEVLEAAKLESFLFGEAENVVESDYGREVDDSLLNLVRGSEGEVERKEGEMEVWEGEKRKREKDKVSEEAEEVLEADKLASFLFGKAENAVGSDDDDHEINDKTLDFVTGSARKGGRKEWEMGEGEGKKKKRKWKRKKEKVAEAEEVREAAMLESFLFGKAENVVGSDYGHEFDDNLLDEKPEKVKEKKTKQKKQNGSRGAPAGSELAVLSREANGRVVDEDDGRPQVEGKKAAWVDEEEARTKVKISGINRLRKLRTLEGEEFVSGKDYISRLRAQHAVLSRGVSWAELPSDRRRREKQSRLLQSDEGSDDGDDRMGEDSPAGQRLLQRNDDLVVRSRSRLPQGLIEIIPMRDGNSAEPSNAVVQSVEFHRNSQILMTAGFDKRLRFFQIDGKRNPKVQSIFLDDFPVHKAAFIPDGSRVVAAGRRNFYYMYDLEAGRVERISPLIGRSEKSLETFEVSADSKHIAFLGNEGYILLCSLGTRQWVGSLKMNGSVRSVAFAENGRHLVSSGGDGEIYHWDLRTRRCFHKGTDEGCVRNTSLAVSSDSRLLATGSGSGAVNVYDRDGFIGGVTRPVKTIMNLVTTVDNVKFSKDCQILAITSRMKKNALKLVHLPSYTVFSNWPTLQTPLQYVHSLTFSPGGGYLAVGNAAGRVLLYRLSHYDHA